jgi:hypothetical protein
VHLASLEANEEDEQSSLSSSSSSSLHPLAAAAVLLFIVYVVSRAVVLPSYDNDMVNVTKYMHKHAVVPYLDDVILPFLSDMKQFLSKEIMMQVGLFWTCIIFQNNDAILM